MEFRFENMVDELESFISVRDNKIDIRKYCYIEPVGAAILKAIKMDMPNVEILADTLNPSTGYLITLYTSQYNPNKNFIPVQVVNMSSKEEIKEQILSMILGYDVFKSLPEEDRLDLKSYVDYMIGELLNNAIFHSCSDKGAVISGQVFPKQRKLQICVVDRGVGFLHNLRRRYKVYSE